MTPNRIHKMKQKKQATHLKRQTIFLFPLAIKFKHAYILWQFKQQSRKKTEPSPIRLQIAFSLVSFSFDGKFSAWRQTNQKTISFWQCFLTCSNGRRCNESHPSSSDEHSRQLQLLESDSYLYTGSIVLLHDRLHTRHYPRHIVIYHILARVECCAGEIDDR